MGIKWPTLFLQIHHHQELGSQVVNFDPNFLGFPWSKLENLSGH